MLKIYKILLLIGVLALLGWFVDCSRNCSGEKEVGYGEMINHHDFAGAHEKLSIDEAKIADGGYNKREYVNNYYLVLKAEADYLIDSNDPELEALFLERLSDFDPEKYVPTSNPKQLGEFPDDDFDYSNREYQKCNQVYNNFCLTVIRKAMIRNNVTLATKLQGLIRPDINYEEVSRGGKTYHVWSQTDESQRQARAYLDNYNQYQQQ